MYSHVILGFPLDDTVSSWNQWREDIQKKTAHHRDYLRLRSLDQVYHAWIISSMDSLGVFPICPPKTVENRLAKRTLVWAWDSVCHLALDPLFWIKQRTLRLVTRLLL